MYLIPLFILILFKLKIHLIAAPHMNVKWNNKQMTTCAYSTKIYLIAKKLHEEGHHIIHYGVEGNDVPCSEQVNYIPLEVWEESHGNRSDSTFHVFGDHLNSYKVGSEVIAAEVNKRLSNPYNEVVLSTFGLWTPNLRQIKSPPIEWGIGYDWAWSKYKVFESYGVKVVVPFSSYVYMMGLEIDYKDDLLNGGFQFNNPQANRSCGCGTSFSV